MKRKTYIIFAKDAPVITYKVTTEDNYISEVINLTGDHVNWEFYKKLEEFDERYFEIEPWYWFSGFRYQ